jgi:hypothetical protein
MRCLIVSKFRALTAGKANLGGGMGKGFDAKWLYPSKIKIKAHML